MMNRSLFRNKILISLLIFSLCVSMTIPAFALKETTLCNGCRGDGVRAMQQALINLGYLQGNADGIFGGQTEEAVRTFQRSNGLTPDGLAGTRTLSALGSARSGSSSPASGTAAPARTYKESTLYNGCSGEEVRAMQQELIDLGYLEGTADGRFGDKTEEAVRAFQRKNGLTPDGLAGTKTRSALESARSAAATGTKTTESGEDEWDALWNKLDRKAREILKKEGHSTDGLNYIKHFYSPKQENKHRDYYSVTFYRSSNASEFDWVHSLQFSAGGELYMMYTRNDGTKGQTHNNDPAAKDADPALLAKARQEAKAYMERYGYTSLARLTDRMVIVQISVSKDKKETYYSFTGPDNEFVIRIRVAPSVRVDYFNDQR